VACWTTCCVKGFLCCSHSNFPCPSRPDNCKAVRGLDIWKFCLVLCLQNLWFIPVKKWTTFS
jgi:hypothetical protein